MPERARIVSPQTGRDHRRVAAIVAGAITLLAVIGIPFDRMLLPAHPGFMPAFGALVLLTDSLTAGLLIVQSCLRGNHRVRHLGATYLFSALVIVPHLLAFPGVFSPAPLIGGTDTSVWLWCVWHGGFAAGVLRFVLAPARPPAPGDLRRMVLGVTLTATACALTAIFGLPWLPALLQGGDYHRLNTSGIGPVILAASLAATILVFTRLRWRDPLSTWLFVATLAATLDVMLTLFGGGRFTLGWYSARVLSLVTGVTVLFSLLSELMREAGRVVEANGQLEQLLCTDVLTKVANRRAFDGALTAEWRRAQREETAVSLLMIDIDCFKGYNDRYGHPAGDECLRVVARALSEGLQRPADMVARVGGEEFGILLPTVEEAGAWHVAQRIRAAVIQLCIPHGASGIGYVTISIGVATARPFGAQTNVVALISAADQALYEAKASGRNTIRGTLPCEPTHVAGLREGCAPGSGFTVEAA